VVDETGSYKLKSTSGCSLFLYKIFMIGLLIGHVKDEAIFTATFLRLFFSGHLLSESFECCDFMHMFFL
jgi:hypothetical protein